MSPAAIARARLIDIAQRAGVSVASASRVLNDTGPVSDTVRQQVEAAAHDLGYQPRHSNNSSPASAESVIALMITDTLNPYFHEIVKGAQDEAEMAGVFAMMVDGSGDLERQRRTLEMLGRERMGGVIACATELPADEVIEIYERYRYPFVVINNRVLHPAIATIILDFERAAARAAQHLIDLGHRRIAYVGTSPEEGPTLERKRGIEAALRANGLELCADCYLPSFARLEGGYQAMSQVLDQPEGQRPTGVIVYNDVMAVGALHAVRDHGLRVPDDISVVGFDDIPFTAHTNPPLTTVAPPKYHLGKLAMQYMLRIRKGIEPQGGYTFLQCSMVIRDSTGPAPQEPAITGGGQTERAVVA